MAKRKSSLSLFKRKGKMKEREQALLCIVLATAGGIVTMFLLMLLFAAALSSFPLPLSVFSPAGLIIGSLGSMAAGFFCSLMSREKGFFYGILCGMLLFIILFIVSLLVWRQKLDFYALVKLLTMLLSGAIGGILGVNSQ